jgi:hypothetical protein
MDRAEEPKEPATKAARQEVVTTIAEKLGETEPGAVSQLHLLVKKLGPVLALAFLKETLEIEAQGGMMLPDGTRHRTPGGVFFHLVRTKGPEECRVPWRKKPKTVKPEEGEAKESEQKTPAVKLPPPPACTWEDRLIALQAIATEKGSVSTVKITLIGRPGKIVDKGSCMVTVMQSSRVPALPKGLSTLPAIATNYVVYMAAKQWKHVAEALRDPEDVLIVEGFPQIDTQTGSIAVFATSITTKKLQMAKRPAPVTEAEQQGRR